MRIVAARGLKHIYNVDTIKDFEESSIRPCPASLAACRTVTATRLLTSHFYAALARSFALPKRRIGGDERGAQVVEKPAEGNVDVRAC